MSKNTTPEIQERFLITVFYEDFHLHVDHDHDHYLRYPIKIFKEEFTAPDRKKANETIKDITKFGFKQRSDITPGAVDYIMPCRIKELTLIDLKK